MSAGANAATWLFVPGNTPGRFAKAAAAKADAVVIDLEDAVRTEDKSTARTAAANWLSNGQQAWVRLNAVDSTWFRDDVDAILAAEGLLGILVPKAEDPSTLTALTAQLGPRRGLVALIETALGLHRVHDLAAAPGVTRLAFGSIDLALDINAEDNEANMLLARSTVVLASRVARLPPPIDGVSTDLRDVDAITASARKARAAGFRGKLCIHPAQVELTARALAPDDRELAWALQVLAAVERSTGAVAGLDGQMIDKPVVERARAIFAADTNPRGAHAPS